MQLISRVILILISMCLIVSCRASEQRNIPINKYITLSPPPISSFGYSIQATQIITLKYLHYLFTVKNTVKITPYDINLVIEDVNSHQVWMKIRLDELGIHEERFAGLPPLFQAEPISVAFILMNWPENELENSFIGKNVQFKTTNNMRSLVQNNKEIIHIDYIDTTTKTPLLGQVRYRDLDKNYEMTIQSTVSPLR